MNAEKGDITSLLIPISCLVGALAWCALAYWLTLRRLRGAATARASFKFGLLAMPVFAGLGIVVAALDAPTQSSILGMAFLFLIWGGVAGLLCWYTIEGTVRGAERQRRELKKLQEEMNNTSTLQ
jgi:hypothetical protein